MPVAAARSLAGAKQRGEPFPSVPELADLNVTPRLGQVTMIIGQPGSQKSGLALWWAIQMNLPTLYISADMDASTATERAAACVTGHTVDAVRQAIRSGNEGYYLDALADCRVQFAFDPNPSLDDVADELNAWVELYDEYPQLVVVDNLMDLDLLHENEYASHKQTLLEVKRLARETGAGVIILHHASEGTGSPLDVPPRKALLGKVAQTPEVILGLGFNSATNEMKVGVLKNRHGKSDPTGQAFTRLRVQPEANRFQRWVGNFGYYGYGGDDE